MAKRLYLNDLLLNAKPNGALSLLAMIWIGLPFVGCSQNEEDAKPTEMSQPITSEEAELFAQEIAEAVRTRNKSRYVSFFSKPDLFDSVFDDIDISLSRRRVLESKINRGGNIGEIADSLFKRIVRGARYDFVRVERNDQSVSLVFRFLYANLREIEYHRYEIVRSRKKEMRAVDLFFFFEDRSLAKGLRQSVLLQLLVGGELKSKSGNDLLRELPVDPRRSEIYKKCIELTVAKKWNEAWSNFKKLPDEINRHPEVQMHKLQVAAKLDSELFSSAFSEAQSILPENIRVDFFGIVVFRREGNHEKVVELVDSVFRRVKDPYLKIMKIDSLVRLNRLKLARELLEEFKSKSENGMLLLIHEFELAVAENDFELSLSILDRLKGEYGLEHQNLSELPRYTELLKSSKYKEWKSNKKNGPK